MFAIVLLTCSSVVSCLGVGALALRLAGENEKQITLPLTLGDVGLFGMVVLTILATLLNFLVGLSAYVTTAVFVAGLVSAFKFRSKLVCAGRFGTGLALLVAIVAIVLKTVTYFAYSSASAHYDTGLYHLQSILMAGDGPVIIGQANLHMRFGYNTLWFVLSAILNVPIFGSGGAYIANPVFFLFIVVGTAQRAAFAWRNVGFARSAIFGTLLLVVFLDDRFMLSELGTPNTDVASNSLVIYAVFLLLFFSDARSIANEHVALSRWTAFLLPVVISFGVTTKLSVLPIALAFFVVPLALVQGNLNWRDVWRAAPLLGLLIGGWLARGVLTSGCLAYPSARSCLPVPWRIDPRIALDDMAWMRAWARTPKVRPDLILSDWNWIHGWLVDFKAAPIFGVLISLSILAFVCFLLRLMLSQVQTTWSGLTVTQRVESSIAGTTALAGLAFWFLVAPLPRYGAGWLVLPFMLLEAHIAPSPRRTMSIALAGPIWFYTGRLVRLVARYQTREGALVTQLRTGDFRMAARGGQIIGPWVAPLAALYFGLKFLAWLPSTNGAVDFPNIPSTPIEARTTKSGLSVNVPSGEDKSQCWDAPRPCTPVDTFSQRLTSTKVGIWHMMTIDPR